MSSQERLNPKSRERFPRRPKTVLPDNVEQLLDELWQKREEYPPDIVCWKCEAILPLDEVKFDWPIGTYKVYFPGIPAYECRNCDETYLPEPVRDRLSKCVDAEIEHNPPEKPTPNPRAIAFKRLYGSSNA